MRTASLFASSTLQSSEQPDEVERLRAMAAKLRQEAVSLEFQQKAAVAAASEKFFRKLDVDQNGSISVQELRQGLAKVFKTELPEQRARQLVQEFDVNGDGALQLEEFVGVDALRNRLDALMQADRDRERQQAKDAQAQTEAAQLKEAQLELVNDKPPTASDKTRTKRLDRRRVGDAGEKGTQRNTIGFGNPIVLLLRLCQQVGSTNQVFELFVPQVRH